MTTTLLTDAHPQTILIVDDTPANLGVIVEILENRGYRVLIAQDGEEGLQRASFVQPDLILLDVMMPGLNGFEVCRRLKNRTETASIPVIFMTSLSDTENKVSGFEAGGVDYVTKPLRLDEVMARIGIHLKLQAMQKQLTEQNIQLQQCRAGLEQQVAERTAELSKTNQQLLEEIAERKHIQERLVLVDFALNHVQEAAYLIDASSRFIYVNDESSRALGYSREALLGMGLHHIERDFPQEQFTQAWQKLEQYGSLTFETYHRAKDGHEFPVEVAAKYFQYEGCSYILALARDISERKAAQHQLQLLNHALDQVSETIFLMADGSPNFLYVNKTAAVLLGYDREQLTGNMGVYDIDPLWNPMMIEEAWIKLRHDQTMTFESLHRAKSGRVFPVEITANYFEYDGREYSFAITREITERKRLETLLHNREQEFRTLVENSPDAIARFDSDCHYLYVNPAMADAHRSTPEAMLGRCPVELSAASEGALIYQEAIRSVLETGEPLACEILADTSDKENPGVHYVRFVPERNQTGMIASVLAISRDITTLKESERKLSTLAENSPDIIARFDREGRYVYLNSAIEKALGISRQAFIGKTFGAATSEHGKPVDPISIAAIKDGIQKVFLAEAAMTIEFSWWIQQAPHIFEFRFLPEFDASGSVGSVLGIARDITERKQAEEEQRLATSVFASALEGIMVTDAKGKIIFVNSAFSKITGYEPEEVVGQTPRHLKSELHDKAFFANLWHTLNKQGYWSGEIWNRRKSGEVYPQRMTISTVLNEQGSVGNYIGIFSDISLLKQQEKQLEALAYYDPLTGIPNRVLLNERMREAIAQADRENFLVAVAFFDLDAFKPINDGYGHPAGDRLLIEIAQRIKRELRNSDTVARLGGDEFVLLLPGLSHVEGCKHMLERLLEAISAPFMLESQNIAITASIGVSIYPSDDVDSDTLLRHADQAMYQAKQMGKNRIQIYDPELDKRISIHQQEQQRLAVALRQEEFELYYQPKIELDSRRVIGAEALIRWRKPGYGLVSPGEFLPLLEKTDLAVELDRWVMTTVLKQMTIWQEEGLVLPVSVNLSARSIAINDFSHLLQQLLEQFPRVNPEHFEMEILENEALHDLALSSQVMLKCQKLGVKFALDDFGTGYSSLSYLRHLPAQTLKIDQSFVRDMLVDEEDLAIVQGVIGLAQAFKRQVIAEGVETLQHGEQLLKMGCKLAQGYGIAKPMQADKLPTWIADWHHANHCTNALGKD